MSEGLSFEMYGTSSGIASKFTKRVCSLDLSDKHFFGGVAKLDQIFVVVRVGVFGSLHFK